MKISMVAFFVLLPCSLVFSQVSINSTGSPPDSSAMLDVGSTTKGLLPPRMTAAEMNAISNPATGLMIFNLDINKPVFFDGNLWLSFDGQYYCGLPFIDSRDGKIYTTVPIGTQCWMAENLNMGTRIDGYTAQSDNGTIEKYCYADLPANCNTYGGLYQWDEMMQYTTTEGTQGICPSGWHIPSDAEWDIIVNLLGGSSVAGGKMKEAGYAHWNSPNTGASNESGFTALPGGYRNSDASFILLGNNGLWWSSTEQSGSFAWNRSLGYNHANIYRDSNYQTYGFSLRCLKD